jgi:hypothetical protein
LQIFEVKHEGYKDFESSGTGLKGAVVSAAARLVVDLPAGNPHRQYATAGKVTFSTLFTSQKQYWGKLYCLR